MRLAGERAEEGVGDTEAVTTGTAVSMGAGVAVGTGIVDSSRKTMSSLVDNA